jgi:hypothetical protein
MLAAIVAYTANLFPQIYSQFSLSSYSQWQQIENTFAVETIANKFK